MSFILWLVCLPGCLHLGLVGVWAARLSKAGYYFELRSETLANLPADHSRLLAVKISGLSAAETEADQAACLADIEAWKECAELEHLRGTCFALPLALLSQWLADCKKRLVLCKLMSSFVSC